MNLLEFLCFLDFIFLQPLSCRPPVLPSFLPPSHAAHPLVMSSALVIPRASCHVERAQRVETSFHH